MHAKCRNKNERERKKKWNLETEQRVKKKENSLIWKWNILVSRELSACVNKMSFVLDNEPVRDEQKYEMNKTRLLWNVSIVTIESNVGFLDDWKFHFFYSFFLSLLFRREFDSCWNRHEKKIKLWYQYIAEREKKSHKLFIKNKEILWTTKRTHDFYIPEKNDKYFCGSPTNWNVQTNEWRKKISASNGCSPIYLRNKFQSASAWEKRCYVCCCCCCNMNTSAIKLWKKNYT